MSSFRPYPHTPKPPLHHRVFFWLGAALFASGILKIEKLIEE